MEKLFYQDTHITQFTARVTDCIEYPDGYAVVLDRTAFFPEEGGQGADTGIINDSPVLDVQIKDDIIYHIMKKPMTPGSTVVGAVDWEQRFDYMQQHSGEHILSGLIHTTFGYNNVGFHLGKEEVTMDFDGVLTWEQVKDLEFKANRIIWQNLPILTTFPDPSALRTMEYRSKLDLAENVRIVEIPGVDLCACCAPHVDTTGQIGLLKVTGLQNHRGGVRLTIQCGKRALAFVDAHQESVTSISQLLSVKQEAVYEGVIRVQEEALQYKLRINELQAQLLELKTRLLPSPDLQPNVVLFTGELDNLALRNTVNSLCEKYSGYCAAFSGNDQDGYRFIIGSTALDCREVLKTLKEGLQAKGGGSALMVQGNVAASEEAIRSVLQ